MSGLSRRLSYLGPGLPKTFTVARSDGRGRADGGADALATAALRPSRKAKMLF